MSLWEEYQLGSLVDILSGFAFDSERFSDFGEIPIVRIRDVVPGHSSTFYRGQYDPRYVLNDGDMLIGMDGEFNCARWRGGAALLNQRVCRIKASNENLDDHYLFYFLPTALKAIENITPYVTVKHLSVKTIRDIKIPLPPPAEQKRIAKVLDQAKVLIDKRLAALTQLESLTQSTFLELFGNPTTNPKGFPKKSLTSLVRDGDTINYGVVQPGDDLDIGIPLVRVGDLIGGKIRHSHLKRIDPSIEADYKRSRLHGDEILVSCVGSIGTVALADESVKGFNIARAVARIPLDKTTNRVFMAAYLNTNFVQRYFVKESRTVSQPTLNIKQLSETPVMFPPLEMQQEFCRRVQTIEKVKVAQQASLSELDDLFTTL